MQQKLFSHPKILFRLLRNTPFCRGLPRDRVLEDKDIARTLKTAVACEEVSENSFEKALHAKLDIVWRNGWLHSEKGRKTTHTVYKFASVMHRWLVRIPHSL